MKIALILAGVTVVAAGVVACGGSEDDDQHKRCEAVCADQVDCTDAPVTDCDTTCASNEASTKASGCEKEYDALLSCTEALDDKCQTTAQCGPGVGTDWSDCITRYCETHKTASVCSGT